MGWSDIFKAIPFAASSPFALIAYGIAVGAVIALSLSVTRHRNILKRLESIPGSEREKALRIAMGPTLKEGMTAKEWNTARIHLYLFVAFIIVSFIVVVIFLDATFHARSNKSSDVGKWSGKLPSDNIVQIYPGVEIVSAKHIVDFTKWTPANNLDTKQCCSVTWETDMIIRRVRKDALVFAKRVATTGGEPQFTSDTHAPPVYRQVIVDVIRGPQMNKYDVLFDISHDSLDIPFHLNMRTVRFGSFKDPIHEDLYLDIFQPSREETLVIHFSPTKPGKKFRFVRYGNVDGISEHPFFPASEDIDTNIPNTLRWTIRYPALGNSYKVEWDW
jgi:hypothetical protein